LKNIKLLRFDYGFPTGCCPLRCPKTKIKNLHQNAEPFPTSRAILYQLYTLSIFSSPEQTRDNVARLESLVHNLICPWTAKTTSLENSTMGPFLSPIFPVYCPGDAEAILSIRVDLDLPWLEETSSWLALPLFPEIYWLDCSFLPRWPFRSSISGRLQWPLWTRLQGMDRRQLKSFVLGFALFFPYRLVAGQEFLRDRSSDRIRTDKYKQNMIPKATKRNSSLNFQSVVGDFDIIYVNKDMVCRFFRQRVHRVLSTI